MWNTAQAIARLTWIFKLWLVYFSSYYRRKQHVQAVDVKIQDIPKSKETQRKQPSDSDSDMTQILELSEWKIKISMINMLTVIMEKK